MSKSVSTNVFRKKSGIESIQQYMEGGRTVTALEALSNFGIFRLASTIEVLRKRGLNITTELKEDPNGKVYARYTLVPKKELKVGARVRIIEDEGFTAFFRVGDEGVVIELSDDAYIAFDKGYGATASRRITHWYACLSQLEAI